MSFARLLRPLEEGLSVNKSINCWMLERDQNSKFHLSKVWENHLIVSFRKPFLTDVLLIDNYYFFKNSIILENCNIKYQSQGGNLIVVNSKF